MTNRKDMRTRSSDSTRRIDGGGRDPDRHSCQGANGGNSSLGGGKAAAADIPAATKPGRVWLVTSRLGTGKSPTFLQCSRVGTTAVGVTILIGDPDVHRHSLQHGWMLKKSCFRSSRSFFKISLIFYISFFVFHYHLGFRIILKRCDLFAI
jgi:hypothetical protein